MSIINIEIWYRNRNSYLGIEIQHSEAQTEIRIEIPMLKSKPTQHADFDIEIERSIKIWTK
jgi:hypothetical protein